MTGTPPTAPVTVRIAHNNVIARLLDVPDRGVALSVSELLSYEVEGAEHMTSVAKGHWSGRSSFYSFKTHTFPAGFVSMVTAHLQARGIRVHLVRRAAPAPLGPPVERAVLEIDALGRQPDYEYQLDAVRQLLRHGWMVAQLATGSGKSRVARLAYHVMQRPTLFITTRSILLHQMKDAFERDLKIPVGVLGDSEWSPRVNGMNVGMVQTLALYSKELTPVMATDAELRRRRDAEDKEVEALKASPVAKKLTGVQLAERARQIRERHRKSHPDDATTAGMIKAQVDAHAARRLKVLELLKRFELVLLEEAHESGGDSYYDVLNCCVNAHYRMALTATPFMRQSSAANMRLMAVCGNVGIRVSEQQLIGTGILSTPYFRYITTAPPPDVRRGTTWQRAYKLGIVENETRNRCIVAEARRAVRAGLSVMVLVSHKQHGRLLLEQMQAAGLQVDFIFGEHQHAERAQRLAALEAGRLQVLIGSSILDVGVDVPALGMVILAGGGKDEVQLRQRIGRGLRRKKNGPNVAFVIDFNDPWNSHLATHAVLRRAIVESTPGFAERVLPHGADFDWSIFEEAITA